MSAREKISLSAADVKNLFAANAKPLPGGLRVMITVPALQTENFTPSASTDGRGNPVGLIGLDVKDGVPLGIFRNPKDSADAAHSLQRLPLDGTGVLIFPVAEASTGMALLARLEDEGLLKALRAREPNVGALDGLLKTVHGFYKSRGLTPDMYNTDTRYQVEKMQTADDAGDALAGLWVKKPLPVSLIVLQADDPQQLIEFKSTGRFIHGAAQFGAGMIVLISEGDEIRKMAPDFALRQYQSLDGKPLDLAALPRFSAAKLAAPPPAAALKSPPPQRRKM